MSRQTHTEDTFGVSTVENMRAPNELVAVENNIKLQRSEREKLTRKASSFIIASELIVVGRVVGSLLTFI